MSVNGGALQSGGITVAYGDSIQLSALSIDGWNQQRWEIIYFPAGYATPTGWTLDSTTGFLFSTAVIPPVIPMPANTLWGKWLFRLRVNDAVTNDAAATTLFDVKSGVEILSDHGIHDLGSFETNQWNKTYATHQQANLRIFDAGIGGGGGGGSPTGAAGGDLGGNYPNPNVLKIHGSTVPAGGGLTVGNVLQVSAAAALIYAAINLAGGANFVTGRLPIANIAFGAADQVLTTNHADNDTAWTLIKDANVDPAAAIAGTKIAPNFGSQNVSTTGTLAAGATTLGATTVSTLTDSGLGLGVVHSSAGGVFSSSLIVNADVDAAAGIVLSKLGQTGATSGQVATWNGSAWAPTTPSVSLTGIPLGTPADVVLWSDGVTNQWTGSPILNTSLQVVAGAARTLIRAYGVSFPGWAAIYMGNVTPGDNNYTLATDWTNEVDLNAPHQITFALSNVGRAIIDSVGLRFQTTPDAVVGILDQVADTTTNTLILRGQAPFSGATTPTNKSPGNVRVEIQAPISGGSPRYFQVKTGTHLQVQMGELPSSATFGTIWLGNVTPDATNVAISGNGTSSLFFALQSATGSFSFDVNNGAEQLAAFQQLGGINNLFFGTNSTVAAVPSRVKPLDRTTDTATAPITIEGMTPWASSTGTNRNPGNVVLNIPSPASGGIDGVAQVTNGGVVQDQFGVFPGLPTYGTIWLGQVAADADHAAIAGDGLKELSFGIHTVENTELGFTFYINPTFERIFSVTQVGGTNIVTIGQNTTQFGAHPNRPGLIKLADRDTDIATADLTFQASAPFVTATGANRTPGNLVFNIPGPTNGGTTTGFVKFTNNGTTVASFGLASGSGGLLTAGTSTLWLDNVTPSDTNFTINTTPNHGTVFNSALGSYSFLAGGTSVILVVSQFTQNSVLQNFIQFRQDKPSNITVINQASDIATNDMSVTTQKAFATASGANRVSGNLLLESAIATNGGTTVGRVALRPGQVDAFSADSSTHLTLFGGPTWTVGSGAPSSSEVDGSLYTNKQASNGDLYLRRGSTWLSLWAAAAMAANSIIAGNGLVGGGLLSSGNVTIDANVDASTIVIVSDVIQLGTVPLAKIASSGATSGQALIWNGSAWAPSTNFAAQNITTTGSLSAGATTVTSLRDTGLGLGVVHSDGSGNFTSSTIVNADISSSAAVAVAKLAGGSDKQILSTSGTTPTWVTIAGDITGAATDIRITQIRGGTLDDTITVFSTEGFVWDAGVDHPTFRQNDATGGHGGVRFEFDAQNADQTTGNGVGGKFAFTTGLGHGTGVHGTFEVSTGATKRFTLGPGTSNVGEMLWVLANLKIDQSVVKVAWSQDTSLTGSGNPWTIIAQSSLQSGNQQGADLILGSGAGHGTGIAGKIDGYVVLRSGATDILRARSGGVDVLTGELGFPNGAAVIDAAAAHPVVLEIGGVNKFEVDPDGTTHARGTGGLVTTVAEPGPGVNNCASDLASGTVNTSGTTPTTALSVDLKARFGDVTFSYLIEVTVQALDVASTTPIGFTIVSAGAYYGGGGANQASAITQSLGNAFGETASSSVSGAGVFTVAVVGRAGHNYTWFVSARMHIYLN